MLVQCVRELLPRAIERLLQGVRLQHERIPLLQCIKLPVNRSPIELCLCFCAMTCRLPLVAGPVHGMPCHACLGYITYM